MPSSNYCTGHMWRKSAKSTPNINYLQTSGNEVLTQMGMSFRREELLILLLSTRLNLTCVFIVACGNCSQEESTFGERICAKYGEWCFSPKHPTSHHNFSLYLLLVCRPSSACLLRWSFIPFLKNLRNCWNAQAVTEFFNRVYGLKVSTKCESEALHQKQELHVLSIAGSLLEVVKTQTVGFVWQLDEASLICTWRCEKWGPVSFLFILVALNFHCYESNP